MYVQVVETCQTRKGGPRGRGRYFPHGKIPVLTHLIRFPRRFPHQTVLDFTPDGLRLSSSPGPRLGAQSALRISL